MTRAVGAETRPITIASARAALPGRAQVHLYFGRVGDLVDLGEQPSLERTRYPGEAADLPR